MLLLKRLTVAVLILTVFLAPNAFSQKKPADILVGKCAGQPGCDAQYASLKDAIARAEANYIIEIIDTGIYEEGQIVIGSSKIGHYPFE